LDQGNRVQGLTRLISAAEQLPGDQQLQDFVVATYLKGLRSGDTDWAPLAKSIEPLLRTDEQIAEFHCRVEEGFKGQADTVAELDRCLRVYEASEAKPFLVESPQTHDSMRVDRWFRARLNQLLQQASAEERTQI